MVVVASSNVIGGTSYTGIAKLVNDAIPFVRCGHVTKLVHSSVVDRW